jgi:hypothetical protein
LTANLPALKEADPKLILQRYLSDESTKVIAQSYGVTRQALGQHLLKHAETEWKEAQVARAISRKEQAEDELEAVTEKIENADKEQRDRIALSISLAREKLKAAQWDLERVCRRIYGQDQPPAHASLSISLNFGTNQTQANVVDAEVIDETKR